MDSKINLEPYEPWYKYITVEPPMFLYMMAFMITSVIEQTFYVFKACSVNHGYSEDICYNITQYDEINKEVQVTVSSFLKYNGMAGHAVPLFLAFFLGAYSDKRGRKLILLAGLLGKLYFSIMITVNTVKEMVEKVQKKFVRSLYKRCYGYYPYLCPTLFIIDWPLEYVIYTAAFPSALTGADLAIFAGCFAYIADVSSTENRTFRVGVLDVVYLSTMPTGVALGNVLYNKVVNRSFTAMFAINTSFMALATLYCLIFLKWQTQSEQKSLREAGVTNPVADFFDWRNIQKTMVTLTKKRTHNRRVFLWFLLISMALYTFQRYERSVMYLYTQTVFKWDTSEFSYFRTYLSTAYVLLMLFGIPLMTKVFNWKDTVIVMFGATAHITGHFIYAHATEVHQFYVGATAAALGPCVAPLIRSMTSKILEPGEKGVAYAFLSVMENAVEIFASVVYSSIYAATLNSVHINSIFYFTMGTQVVVFIFAVLMEILLKGRRIESLIDPDETRISERSS